MCSYNNLLTREMQNFHVAFLGRFIPLTGAGFFVKFSCQVRPIIMWSTTMKTISILFRSKVELDEERVRSLREKDGLKRQLEDLVVVERDQMVKTAASDQAQVRECEDEVERMADIVKSLQSELAMTTKKLQVMI